MSGWLKLFAVLLAVSVAAYRYHDHGGFGPRDEAAMAAATVPTPQVATIAPAANAVASQASGPYQADAQFLQSYMTSIQRMDRVYAFGTTVQNISLPSGRNAQLTIQKTKTGWCPIRNEATYQVNMSVSVK